MAELEVSFPDGPAGAVVVTMAGEFDLANADLLRDCLGDVEAPRDVVLDMGAVTFIDSTTLAVIAFTLQRGLNVTVSNESEIAHKVLTVSGLENLLTSVDGAA
jgi:anti-anti-sigma factor